MQHMDLSRFARNDGDCFQLPDNLFRLEKSTLTQSQLSRRCLSPALCFSFVVFRRIVPVAASLGLVAAH